ncbi:MAG: hypothetical protein K1X47_05815 [Cyclobacteriaceae bacterium]|nr:hypothetical protein [Cyclobacteriaceae bacterium]
MDLISTHESLSFPVIARIFKKMKIGLQFGAIQVVDNAIIDGHHRFVAAQLANYSLDRIQGIRSLAKVNYEWQTVQFIDVDWDTAAKVEMLNKMDARLNNITLDELLARIA